jgi:D-alanyl-D-alanine carboxypeptidase (penicillin-binding protein 5/6)
MTLIAAIIVLYVPTALLAPLPETSPTAMTAPLGRTTAPTLSLPNYGASAIAAVGYPGVLAAGGSRSALPMASITKIITALVVLQKEPLKVGQAGPNITFTAADQALLRAYAARDGDVYPIQVGGTMTELNVMTVALVASANNYARALVDWAYGSEANFLPVARAWLKAKGMTSTTLTDSTGLNPQNVSTPTDLITLGKLALADPVISRLIDTSQTTLPVVGTIANTNTLLGTAGIDGIKTGTLNSAGASLLFSSRFTMAGHTITLVGVVLDGPDHPTINAQILALVAQAKAGFSVVKLATRGQPFVRYTTPWGQRSSGVAARNASVVVWGGTPVSEKVSARRVSLPTRGAVIGSVRFSAGGQSVLVNLRLSKALTDPGSLWRLAHPNELF